MGGSGGQAVLTAMADMCNKLPVATMCLRQAEVLGQRHGAALAEFAHDLPQPAHEQAGAAPAEAAVRPG